MGNIVTVDDKGSGKINKTTALAMALQGKSDTEIKTHFSVSKQAVSRALKEYRTEIKEYMAWSENKDTFLERLQFRLSTSLDTDEQLLKIPARRRISDMELLEKSIRLIRNQSTENIAHIVAFDLTPFK